ncbi:MAG: hypothetical protein KAU10_02440 [Dehalococcoidia bacterium]|nr:hypothetical protein [Dehalococcoidia bacterium]
MAQKRAPGTAYHGRLAIVRTRPHRERGIQPLPGVLPGQGQGPYAIAQEIAMQPPVDGTLQSLDASQVGLSKIVRVMTRFLILPILVYGVYLIAHGHSTIGGGFQGGAVVASGVALLIVTFGSRDISKSLKASHLDTLMSIGLLTFIGLAFGGLGHSPFFRNFLVGSPVFGHIPPSGSNAGGIWEGGVAPLMEIGVGLLVAAGLTAILLVMARQARMAEGEVSRRVGLVLKVGGEPMTMKAWTVVMLVLGVIALGVMMAFITAPTPVTKTVLTTSFIALLVVGVVGPIVLRNKNTDWHLEK